MSSTGQLINTISDSANQDEQSQQTIPTSGVGSVNPRVIGDEPVSIKPGTMLNKRFNILEAIGSGGMGTVYKALDERDREAGNSHFIAIKVLNHQCQKSAQFLQALYEEAKKTQSLSHPNIVTVYDFDRDSNLAYITMEWIEGAPLGQIIKGNPSGVKLSEAIDMITQMGSALCHAHSKHIIHLDLKPDNIYFDRNGHIKILDFGIAQKFNESLTNNDQPQISIGLTPAYASRELLNDKIPDPCDDIYAFACVSYELLTGKHPYDRQTSDSAFRRKLVPKKIKCLNNRQWKALKKALALQKQDRTESIEKFLSDFNAKKSSVKYIILGGFIALFSLLAYKQWQTKYFSIQQQEQITGSPAIYQAKTKLTTAQAGPSSSNAIQQQEQISVSPSKEEIVPSVEEGKINLWTDKKIYTLGDTLTIQFSIDRALYVQLFVINSIGEVSLLFPNPYQPDNLLEPDQIYQIPPEGEVFTLDILEPEGMDKIIALGSAKPFPDNSLNMDEYGNIQTDGLTERPIQSEITYQIVE